MKCLVAHCKREEAWRGLCSVHAARDLNKPVSIEEASKERQDNG